MLELSNTSPSDISNIDVTFLQESKIFFLSTVTWLILLALFVGPAFAAGRTGAESFYSRGEALVKQGKADAAIKEFDRAVQLNPENAGMRTRLAWLLLDQNRPASALPHFERLVSQRPQDKTAISGVAICFLKMGHPEWAVVVLNRGLQFLPRDTLLLKLKGEALSSRRETAGEAVKVYEKLLKIQPGKAEWAKARQTATLLAASYSYFEAQAYLKKGDRAAALKAFKSALEFEPEAIGYRTHYGWVLLEDGQGAQALQAFQEVLRLDPNKKDAYLGLALAQLRLGEPAEALKTTGRGLELFPDEVQLLEVQAGAARARPETLPLAVETYNRLLALRPGDFQLDLKLAQIMLEQGRTNEAEKRFQIVLQKDPGNYEANLGLARLDLMNDAYGLALVHLEKASTTAPESQEAARSLGRVKELMRPQLQTHGGA